MRELVTREASDFNLLRKNGIEPKTGLKEPEFCAVDAGPLR